MVIEKCRCLETVVHALMKTMLMRLRTWSAKRKRMRPVPRTSGVRGVTDLSLAEVEPGQGSIGASHAHPGDCRRFGYHYPEVLSTSPRSTAGCQRWFKGCVNFNLICRLPNCGHATANAWNMDTFNPPKFAQDCQNLPKSR